jgi:hypothetical protein
MSFISSLRTTPATTPDKYVEGLTGWQRARVGALRAEVVRTEPSLDERLKWGHLVFFANGPALLIRAEPQRVLFGFWRGRRLREIEPRLKPGGKYEMATFDIREGVTIKPAVVSRLARQAVALNRKVGDPTKAAAARTKRGGARKTRPVSTRRRPSGRA